MNNLLKTIATVTLTLAFVSCQNFTVQGSGEAYEVVHPIGTIDNVTVEDIGVLRIQNGANPQLIVIAQNEIHEHLVVNESGRKLEITPRNGYSLKASDTLEYILVTDSLKNIDISGSVSLVSTHYQTESLDIDASGTSVIDLSVQADDLSISASGLFNGYLAGNAQQVSINLNGTSNLDAFDLLANEINVDIAGTGNAYVSAEEWLEASASGVSKIEYKGNPELSISASGVSSVNRAEP